MRDRETEEAVIQAVVDWQRARPRVRSVQLQAERRLEAAAVALSTRPVSPWLEDEERRETAAVESSLKALETPRGSL